MKKSFNMRMNNPKIEAILKEMEEKGFTQTQTAKGGIIALYELYQTNPEKAAYLALTA